MTLDGTRLSWDVELADGQPIRVACSEVVDGWRRLLELVEVDGRVVTQRVVFEPVDADPFLSSTFFRRHGLGAFHDDALADLEGEVLAPFLPPGWRKPDRPGPGRKQRPDEHYLVWAIRYLEACARDPRHPVRWIVENYPHEVMTESAVQARLTKAKTRGLLERDQGRPGGRLRPKAVEMLPRLRYLEEQRARTTGAWVTQYGRAIVNQLSGPVPDAEWQEMRDGVLARAEQEAGI